MAREGRAPSMVACASLVSLLWPSCGLPGFDNGDGSSLAAHKQQIAGYAMMKGWQITETFIEAGVLRCLYSQRREA